MEQKYNSQYFDSGEAIDEAIYKGAQSYDKAIEHDEKLTNIQSELDGINTISGGDSDLTLKQKINSLITKSNEVMKKENTDLTTTIIDLCDGYGKGDQPKIPFIGKLVSSNLFYDIDFSTYELKFNQSSPSSTGDYYISPNIKFAYNLSWELCITYKLNVIYDVCLIGSQSYYYDNPTIEIQQSGKYIWGGISRSNSTWDNGIAITLSTPLKINNYYKFILGKNETELYLKCIDLATGEIIGSSINRTTNNQRANNIPVCFMGNARNSRFYSTGDIDLTHTYYKENGEIVWGCDIDSTPTSIYNIIYKTHNMLQDVEFFESDFSSIEKLPTGETRLTIKSTTQTGLWVQLTKKIQFNPKKHYKLSVNNWNGYGRIGISNKSSETWSQSLDITPFGNSGNRAGKNAIGNFYSNNSTETYVEGDNHVFQYDSQRSKEFYIIPNVYSESIVNGSLWFCTDLLYNNARESFTVDIALYEEIN